jgi:photosystem II stability/assembly factor-like uncharacterized protein
MPKKTGFKLLSAPLNEELLAVARGPSGTIVTVGWKRTLLRSTDGGATFTSPKVKADANAGFGGVIALAGGIWIAVGGKGTVVRSEDDGATWKAMKSGTTIGAVGLALIDNVIVAVGAGSRLLVLRSLDAGCTWKRSLMNNLPGLWRVFEVDSALLGITQKGAVLRSTDTGVSWSSVRDAGSAHFVGGACAPGRKRLIAVGYDFAKDEAIVIETRDAGNTWATRGAGNKLLKDVAMTGSGLVACGDGGTILTSDLEGKKWKAAGPTLTANLNGAWGDARGAILVGANGTVLVSSA